MNDIIDMTTNRIEAVPYFVVRYSYNPYIIFREFCVAQRVFLRMLLFAVLRTVKLNNQFGFCAITINDIPINYFLTNKSNRVIFQKIIPKMFFFFGHVFAQFFCERNDELVVSPVQANPSTASGPPPFAQGRLESSSSKKSCTKSRLPSENRSLRGKPSRCVRRQGSKAGSFVQRELSA